MSGEWPGVAYASGARPASVQVGHWNIPLRVYCSTAPVFLFCRVVCRCVLLLLNVSQVHKPTAGWLLVYPRPTRPRHVGRGGEGRTWWRPPWGWVLGLDQPLSSSPLLPSPCRHFPFPAIVRRLVRSLPGTLDSEDPDHFCLKLLS